MQKKTLNPIFLVFLGCILGSMVYFLDSYFVKLGNIFMHYPIWLLLGVVISFYSEKEQTAILNNFIFYLSVLNMYFVMVELLHSFYNPQFIKLWTYFSFIFPMLSYLAWKSKSLSILSILFCLGSFIVCFLLGEMCLSNFGIHLFLCYFMFLKNRIWEERI